MGVYNPKFATLTFPLAKGRGSEPRGLSSTVFVLLLFLVLINITSKDSINYFYFHTLN